ncbi:MAG: DUF4494 domain-containing protein [Cytophagales bacterium]|nr:DUF4494 domain-containing protein [Cytophagales bacterium]
MKTWFLCKVRCTREDNNGHLKTVTDAYLVDALTFTEAESRIYGEMEQVVRGEFIVKAITKSNFTDIFRYSDSEVWHKCKVAYVVSDADSGKEKTVKNMMLVTADDVRTAYERMVECVKNMLVSFRVIEVAESPIVEVFEYGTEEEVEPEPGFKSLSEIVQE